MGSVEAIIGPSWGTSSGINLSEGRGGNDRQRPSAGPSGAFADPPGRGPPGCATLEPEDVMVAFLLWCLLLVLCWPLALAVLVLAPLIWLVLLPFRLAGYAVEGVLGLVRLLFTLPGRLV